VPGRGRARGLGWCAPLPAVGQSDWHAWEGGCTCHRRARRARRPRGPVCMCRNPFGGGGSRRQGGQQSGAEGERPLLKHGFADGPEDDGGRGTPPRMCRRDNEPARVAMGRIGFLWEQTERIVRARWPAVSPRIRLRSTWGKVYASVRRERIIFHPTQGQARAVPRADKNNRRRQGRRNTGLRARASGRVHGRDDNPVCNFARDRSGGR
jgi:hypothetical protein